MSNYIPRGKFFEEFVVGQKFFSIARTITESDIVTFAGLSGDFNQIHTDSEFAKNTAYGKRIAHGLLVASIASGLLAQSGILEGTVQAFREISKWKFAKPIFIGDTVRVEADVTAVKKLNHLGGGIVDMQLVVFNQNDDMAMKGTWKVLVACRE
ncbi:MAG: MaoC family dehydratase N-terminal domain-containing protein [Anaerolineae bacterium]|nr:MaoC family dehydratase N-terminal domain-containing protein [Anaerolineae bacterium]